MAWQKCRQEFEKKKEITPEEFWMKFLKELFPAFEEEEDPEYGKMVEEISGDMKRRIS